MQTAHSARLDHVRAEALTHKSGLAQGRNPSAGRKSKEPARSPANAGSVQASGARSAEASGMQTAHCARREPDK